MKCIAGHLELEEGRRIGIVNGYEFLLGVIKNILAWISSCMDRHSYNVCNSWLFREGVLENLNVLGQAPSSLLLDSLALFNFNSPLCPLYLSACHMVVPRLLYSSLPLHRRWTSRPSALGCPLYTIASFVNDLSLSGKRHSFLFERIHKSYFCSQEKR